MIGGVAVRISAIAVAACLLTVCFGFVCNPANAATEGWQDPIMIQPNAVYTQCETLEMDDQGNALVVWEQPENVTVDAAIWAREYNRVLGWGEPEVIFDSEYHDGRTTMGMAPNGRAIAAWGVYNESASTLGLCARFFDPVSGWGQIQVVADGLTSLGDVAVDVDSEGNAVCVWGGLYELFVCVYEDGVSWGAPEMIDDGGSPSKVAFDGFGNAIAIWDDYDHTVEASRYVSGQGWSDVVTVSGSVGGYRAVIAVDNAGSALATWFIYNGTAWDMYANLFTPIDGWGEPTLIGPADNGWHPRSAGIAAGCEGEFFVIWQQSNVSSGGVYSVWSRHWTDSDGWEESVRISTEDSASGMLYPAIGANRAGQVVATWSQEGVVSLDVLASRYTPGTGWSIPEVIDNFDSWNAMFSKAAIDPLGNVVVIWDVESIIWGRVYKAYSAPDVMIAEPLDGTISSEPSILVRGFTEPDVDLNINGILSAVESDGSFSLTIALVEGINTITATATDASDNSTTVSVSVTYINPVPALEEELNDTIDELIAVQDELNTAQDDLDAVEAELDATKDELNVTQGELNVLEDGLNATQIDLDATEEELTSTSGDLDDARFQNLVLMAILAVFAILAVVMSIMFFSLRKKMPDMSGKPVEEEELSPPQG